MKPDHKMQVVGVIEGDPRRPRRIALEPLPGGSPLPGLADGKYLAVGTALVSFQPQQRVDDGTKALRISIESYDRLRSLRKRGESPSQAMERLIYKECAANESK
ncbi:hypothetical protein GALL_441410 [mine drainage metagenome]|uniref:Uncharacterized protein n=1 Tax=mine drainage metagenome TaxID=410659 RepID=A0A1J5PTP6_9ZZZZ